jgi:hypothetical protein
VLLRRYPDLPYRAAGLRHTIRPIARRLFAYRRPVIAGCNHTISGMLWRTGKSAFRCVDIEDILYEFNELPPGHRLA